MNNLKTFLPHFVATLVVGTLALIAGFAMATDQNVQAAPGLSNTLVTASTSETNSLSGLINYQGTLRDLDGNLLNGTYDLTFKIYNGPADGAINLWEETHVSVTVRSGYFSVLLGDVSALPHAIFAQPDRYVGVTIDQYDELIPRQRFASVPYAMHAENAKQAENAADGVPVGAVIDWWRADSSTAIPDGYLICNGQTVNDPDSPLDGKALPNLNNRFVRGTTSANAIGITGGADSHTHSINHNHPSVSSTTSTNGAHSHAWAERNSNDYYSYDSNGNRIQIFDWGDGSDTDGAGFYFMAFGSDGFAWTERTGAHSHSVSVDVPNYSGTSGSQSHLPSYMSLLKLCRTK